MPPDLTNTRTKILSASLSLGQSASLSTVAQKLNLSREAVRQQVKILRDLGYLEPAVNRYSPLTLTKKAKVSLGLGIPIYGEIAAGQPVYAEAPPDYTPDFETLLGMHEGDFLLRIRGDSMTGIGIMDGDFVLVRPTSKVDDGDVAVVTLPGENTATLKRVTVQGDTVCLDSENPDYPRMQFPGQDIQIQGRLIAKLGLHSYRRH